MSLSSSKKDAVAIPPDLIEALQAAQHVAVLTGAGISAEPAMPTNLTACFLKK
jgi:hypothetical protein